MEKPSSKVIEVTVISAEGLLVNRRQPAKKNVSITVRSDPFNSGTTGTNKEEGSFPAWNEKLVMDLPAHARFVTVEARSGSRVVGTASIPVSDFAGGHLPENYLSFLTYRLRDSNGEKNGIINLSVKVRGTAGNSGWSRTWMGVPAGGGEKVSGHGGIVTGIPVSHSRF